MNTQPLTVRQTTGRIRAARGQNPMLMQARKTPVGPLRAFHMGGGRGSVYYGP